MGAHSCDLYAEPTDSDSDSPDDEAGADAGAATVNATAANATDDCEMCLVVQREPRSPGAGAMRPSAILRIMYSAP